MLGVQEPEVDSALTAHPKDGALQLLLSLLHLPYTRAPLRIRGDHGSRQVDTPDSRRLNGPTAAMKSAIGPASLRAWAGAVAEQKTAFLFTATRELHSLATSTAPDLILFGYSRLLESA